ncbi:MAG: hypothetical protein ACE5I3_13825, partial [Phycisphaerae bacterium]
MVVVIGVASLWRAAPALASDCDHEIVIPPLHVCTIGELTTFTLEGGEPFHETTSAVQDVRVIAGCHGQGPRRLIFDGQESRR